MSLTGVAVTADELQARFGQAGAIAFRSDEAGAVVADLSTKAGSATVALQGGQVLSWTPNGQVDVLWASPAARLGNGRAFRGGIPVCWPWFGPHKSGGNLPAHGFVRTMTWGVVAAEVRPETMTLRLAPALADAAAHRPWGEDAAVTIDVTVGDALEIVLTTENAGRRPIEITQALHTYLAVADIGAASISGLAGRSYIDQLTGDTCVQDGDIGIDREVDRIYVDTPDTVVVSDPGHRRRVRVAKAGSLSTVIWNPWIGKSAQLADMTADGYKGMVCVETANAGPDAIVIAPGQRHSLVARLSIEAMPTTG